MKTLIVYDSVFGNTEQIALAMGETLKSQEDVKTLRVGDVKPEHLVELKLLIVGSPTRAFRPTPAITRFLKNIPKQSLQGVKAAAFDTRIPLDNVPGFLRVLISIFGYAADPIARRLKKKGAELAVPPEGFFVQDSEGPLKDGEHERAAEWVRSIITAE